MGAVVATMDSTAGPVAGARMRPVRARRVAAAAVLASVLVGTGAGPVSAAKDETVLVSRQGTADGGA